MPRYFFHVREQSEVSRDLEGQDLPDLNAARREAERIAREMIGERVLHGGDIGGRCIDVAEEEGRVLASIRLDEVLFREGQFRIFSDDVTKSAPVAKPISQKSSPK